MNPKCFEKHPSARGMRCDLAPGHDGPHRHSYTGTVWSLGEYERHESPDYADGGVTAAQVEKEAEQRALTLNSAGLAAHFRDKRDMERARAEKAEQERDEMRDAWEGAIESIKEANALINSLRAAEPRPLTPETIEAPTITLYRAPDPNHVRVKVVHPAFDVFGEVVHLPVAITDEMVDRGLDALDELAGVSVTIPTMRAILTAAVTEPPTRPAGAEQLDGHVEASLRGVGLHPLTAEELRTVANNLASEGVRVVTVERP